VNEWDCPKSEATGLVVCTPHLVIPEAALVGSVTYRADPGIPDVTCPCRDRGAVARYATGLSTEQYW
jgi:hypothetical protein